MSNLKVLILGDGLLGSEIYKQTKWDIISRKKDKIVAQNFIEWSSKLDRYDIILNCIAHTNTYSEDRENHWDINYKFVYELISYCNKNDKKLIHISTDYVYCNSNELASENDVPVHCNNWYSYTKLLGDSIVQLLSNNFLICRLSHKPYPFPYDRAWTDIQTNCDYVDVIAKLVVDLIVKNSSGLFNVGTDVKSIFDLANKTKPVEPIYRPINVPSNTTMSLQKLKNFLI